MHILVRPSFPSRLSSVLTHVIGQAGAYLIHDPDEDALNLPAGYGQFDIPLILSAKQYNNDGSLFNPKAETTSLYGDVIQVNGQPWPYFKVQPRKYRLRFLNAGISRTFLLSFQRATGSTEKLPFQVIASDTGLLSGPATTSDLYISIAERYEVVFDFAPFAGQNITLSNARKVAADEDFQETDKVMRFVVSTTPVQDSSRVPAALRTVPFPPPVDAAQVNQSFEFERKNGQWEINGVNFNEVDKRVLANVPRGTVEVWELKNGGGGWSHPIHVHLVDFKVLRRINSKRPVLPYESQGLKDVVWLGPGETVYIEAHYAPWDGVYMFHCHNLIHEDVSYF